MPEVGALAAQAEHSPFIRQLLGSLADAVDPAPADPAIDALSTIAADWLAHGVELIPADPDLALEALSTAYNLGSNEAMGWMGALLVHHALNVPTTEGRPLALEGLGWLHMATLAGDAFASDRLADACAALPGSLVEEWLTLPLYHVVSVH